MSYTDSEILALAETYESPEFFDRIGFARAIERGEKAPVEHYNVKEMMRLTDASQADGWGNGPTFFAYWREVIASPAKAGAGRLVSIPTGTQPIVLDVTGLNGYYGYMIRAQNIQVHSRQAVEPKYRPVLRVDGVEYPCLADTWISASTSKSTGLTPTLNASGNTSLILLRFDQPDGLHQEIVLYPTKSLAGQAIDVFELIPPIDFEPDTIRDLWFDDDVYFRSETIGAGDSPEERNLAWQQKQPLGQKRTEWLSDGTSTFARGHWGPTLRSIGFKVPIHDEAGNEGRRVAFQMDFRVAPNFVKACREGGKWVGFCSSGNPNEYPGKGYVTWPGEPLGRIRSIYAGNGASVIHGDDGWSIRGGYHPGIRTPGHPAQGFVPLHSYAYYGRQQRGGVSYLWHDILARHEAANNLRWKGYTVTPQQLTALLQPGEALASGVSKTGDVFEWNNYPALLVPGEWHRVTQVMQINTPGVADGWLDAYVDGRHCGAIRDVAWRGVGPMIHPSLRRLGIGAVWANLYHGGTLFPLEATWVDMKRLVVKVMEWD
jgi:hypothetical protein